MLKSVTENGYKFDECKKILRESEHAGFLLFGILQLTPLEKSSSIRDLEISMPGANLVLSLSSLFQGVCIL